MTQITRAEQKELLIEEQRLLKLLAHYRNFDKLNRVGA